MPSLDLEALWTVAEAAEHAGVSVGTVRSWASRGHLPIALNADGQPIRDASGRPRYWPLDVARAEAKTRAHARRTIPVAA